MGHKGNASTVLGLHVGDMGREGVAQSLRLDVEKQRLSLMVDLARSLKGISMA